MARLLLAIVSVGSILASMVSISLGAERQYRHGEVASDVPDRYCLQGRIWGYPGNCQFATYEQCSATASRYRRLLRRQSDLRLRASA